MSLEEQLGDYQEAASVEDRHALAARRRRLLPELREGGDSLQGAWALRVAVRVLSEARDAAFGPLPDDDVALRERLARRLAALSPESYRVPVLVVDEAAGGGAVAELVVEILPAPGRGRVDALGPADEAARTAARRAVAAAASLLRKLGYAAEDTDLEVAWQVGGTDDDLAGPSIGLALALAVVARATQNPFPTGVAVTGELDLDGRVVPVAGLEVKVAAARDAGLTRVLVPGTVEGATPVADLAEAASLLWGLRGRTTPKSTLAPPILATAATVIALFLGLLEVPGLLGYPVGVKALPESSIDRRVVLVTWGRADDVAAALAPGPLRGEPVAPVDLSEFADHKSYRATHGVVLARLAEAGAAVISFDVWFRGGDPAALVQLRAYVAATRAAGTEVILPARSSAGRWDGPDPELAAAATTVASADLLREQPGDMVRQFAVGRRDPEPGAPAWSMPVATVAAAQGVEPRWNGPDVLSLGGPALAVPGGRRLLRFPARPAFRHYSYADVYGGVFDPSHFAGAMVLVGGRLGTQDLHRTPAGPWYGVEVLAAATNSLVVDEALRPMSLSARAVAILVVLGLVLAHRRLRGSDDLRRTMLAYLLILAWAWLLGRQASTLGLWWPWTDAAILLVLLAGHASWAGRGRGRTVATSAS